jgi:(S)-citramalyl-CoA lyase
LSGHPDLRLAYMQRSKTRRSLLFVPGTRPERFEKAVASGADIVCLDLEDSVHPEEKATARARVIEFLARHNSPCEIAVRVNSIRTLVGVRDVLALVEASSSPDLVVIPKAESAEELAWVSGILGESRPPPGLIPFVETLKGVALADLIAAAPSAQLLGLGTGDLAAEMAVSMDWEPMQLARLQIVQAAKRARVPTMDGAWLQITDLEGLAEEARRSAALGYSAKVCLHPKQVPVVNAAFTPDAEQAEQARELIAAFEAAGSGAFMFKGRMVDLPVVASARRQLALWEAATRR